jgi:hypothetical protein
MSASTDPCGGYRATGIPTATSNDTLQALAEADVRTYISEPDRGPRRWKDKPEAQQAVYGNRRRIRGEHGKELLRRRGELLERSFAHAYETGGMHVGGFNLSLVMRQLLGKGTPRGWQGFSADAWLAFLRLWTAVLARAEQENTPPPAHITPAPCTSRFLFRLRPSDQTTSATGC